MKLRYLSLFSGIEAASVAWYPIGWECAAVAEIEKFPCAVLAHHYPDVPNLGDITKITAEQIKAIGHVDVVVMGFPCQDLSIAGKRKGMKHADGTVTRSGLFYKAHRIAELSGARFVVAENVPGLFSNNEGCDFASVVGELAGDEFDVPDEGWRNSGFALGPKGLVEWCVLDAQYFRVAQRRERVFIVRDSGNWQDRPPLLLDPQSLRGNNPPSREARKDVAPTLSCRTKGGGGLGTDAECDGAVIATLAANGGQDRDRTGKTLIQDELSRTLNAGGMGRKDWETETFVPTNQGGSFNYEVRRLTPIECARLQGFPDNYLDIIYNGKPACDGPKYRALGNSMAVPVMAWIGKRIEMVLNWGK